MAEAVWVWSLLCGGEVEAELVYYLIFGVLGLLGREEARFLVVVVL